MRRRLAVVLGTVGVLGAGATAALATSAAYSDGAGTSAATPVPGVATAPEITVDSTAPRPTSSEGSTPTGARVRSYAARDAGVVDLRVQGTRLVLVDVHPASGWEVAGTESERRSGVATLEVSFRSPTRTIEFVALLIDGQIVTRVDDESDRDDDQDDDQDDDAAGGDTDDDDTDDDAAGAPGTRPDDGTDAPEVDDDGPEIDEDGPEIDDDGHEIDDDGPEIDEDGPETDETDAPGEA
jgi:hypothetical protein